MTIKVKNCSVISTIWELNVIEYNFQKYYTQYISSTLYDYQFVIERSERMEHVSEQYIASKKINFWKIRTLCHFDYDGHHQIESTYLEQKKHTLIHVFISDDIRKLIFFISCEWMIDDKKNFDENKSHIIWVIQH